MGAPMIAAIDLPWPDRALHPNARKHWGAKARATKAARRDAAWATKAAGVRLTGYASLHVTASFTPPDARRRDTDGMLSSIKPYLDGIADVVGVMTAAGRLPSAASRRASRA
jgi:crossover junction endodeoxyribonuclease RusA